MIAEPIHVYPLSDLKPHILIGGICPCQPAFREKAGEYCDP